MTTTIKLLRAATSGNVPTSLLAGQIGIDEFLGKLYWHQNSGTVTPFPLLAAANTILANNTGAVAAPTYLTTAQIMTMLGAAPLNSPSFTGTITALTVALSGGAINGTTLGQGTPAAITGTSVTCQGTFSSSSLVCDTGFVVTVPATGANVTIATTTHVQILNPAATIATCTVTFPSVGNGTRIEVLTTATITALTCAASGATIKNAPTTLAAGTGFEYIFVSASITWFRIR